MGDPDGTVPVALTRVVEDDRTDGSIAQDVQVLRRAGAREQWMPPLRCYLAIVMVFMP